MKMIPAHLEVIKKHIIPLKDKIAPHREILEHNSKVKDIEKRLRWDLFWAARLPSVFITDLYKYLNDDHIDTALKFIMRELDGK